MNTTNNSTSRRSDNSLSPEGLSPSRQEVLAKINTYEKQGGESFFLDVENDPPSAVLLPQDVDYLNRKFKNKLPNALARLISCLYEKKIKKQFWVRVVGAENLSGLCSGAIVTSNHFSPFENIAVKYATESVPGHKRFYKVVREGNFFMPGLMGFLLKYCDTLPLSRNIHTMENFNKAVQTVLRQGDLLLVYPEQAMWWNYRKPRPYRIGAFYFAVKNHVPVVPCFTTMEDGAERDSDHAPQQYYTVHVMPLLYPDDSLPPRAAAKKLMEQNAVLTRAKYEEVYGLPLKY